MRKYLQYVLTLSTFRKYDDKIVGHKNSVLKKYWSFLKLANRTLFNIHKYINGIVAHFSHPRYTYITKENIALSYY